MMKWFHILFLGGAFCWGNANAGVRMADVLTDDRPERLMEMAAAEIEDSASCRKAAEQLNAEAGRQEKLWREALMSGSPTPQEWVQISEAEARKFKKMMLAKKAELWKLPLWLDALEENGSISHEDSALARSALDKLFLAPQTALNSLESFMDRAALPLPPSPDGDSHEKLLAWKVSPENSLFHAMNTDLVVNRSLEDMLKSCWGDGAMEMLEEVLYRTEEERINQLIRLHADRKVEEARRLSRLPSLTPEQWCWFWKQEQSHEILASFDMDVSLIMCLCPREKVGGEDGDYPFPRAGKPLSGTGCLFRIESPGYGRKLRQEKRIDAAGGSIILCRHEFFTDYFSVLGSMWNSCGGRCPDGGRGDKRRIFQSPGDGRHPGQGCRILQGSHGRVEQGG